MLSASPSEVCAGAPSVLITSLSTTERSNTASATGPVKDAESHSSSSCALVQHELLDANSSSCNTTSGSCANRVADPIPRPALTPPLDSPSPNPGDASATPPSTAAEDAQLRGAKDLGPDAVVTSACGADLATGVDVDGEVVDGTSDASDCATADISPEDTTTTAADATPAVSEPVTPTTPPRLLMSAPLLPPAEDPARMTLVLDLDGTLIASEDEPHAPVPFDYCVDEERFVWLRPGLRRFLESVRPQFEVVLFTAAGESWATCALQRIDPDGRLFDSRLYRDHTVSHDDWPWVKDLSRLGRDLARVVIVDDNPLMFMYQPDNALHVAAYDPQVTGHRDDVLEQVLDVLLHKVLPADDVRHVLRDMKDPISASCVSARHAAAKVAAASALAHMRGKGGARRGAGGLAAAAAAAVVPARASAGAGSTPTAAAAAPVANAVAPGSVQGKPCRRSRRASKPLIPTPPPTMMQPQQTHAQAQPPHPQQQQNLQPAWTQVNASSGAAACNTAGSAQELQQTGEKRHRQPRSRRRGPASAGSSNAAAVSVVMRGQTPWLEGIEAPPVVVSRLARGQGVKQAGRRGAAAAQQAASSTLQRPEQQLHLKLRLLQLQREQESESEEGDAGVESDSRQAARAASASAISAAPAAPAAIAAAVLAVAAPAVTRVYGTLPAEAQIDEAQPASAERCPAALGLPSQDTPAQHQQAQAQSAWRQPNRPHAAAPSAVSSAAATPVRLGTTAAAPAVAATGPMPYATVVVVGTTGCASSSVPKKYTTCAPVAVVEAAADSGSEAEAAAAAAGGGKRKGRGRRRRGRALAGVGAGEALASRAGQGS